MVGIEYCQARQVAVLLHTPHADLSPAVGALGEAGCGDGGRQAGLLLSDVELYALHVVGRDALLGARLVLLQLGGQPALIFVRLYYCLDKLVDFMTCLGLGHAALHLAVVVDEGAGRGVLGHLLQHLGIQLLGGLVNAGLEYDFHFLPPFLILLMIFINFS